MAETYRISKYEVTNAQYAEFLNENAAADPLGLYNPFMGSDTRGGITRTGSAGSFTYSVKTGFDNKPVNYVSFYDSLRFTNWLNNGQGNADTETGAYTITAQGITNNTITRNPGANIFLPSENEWYKAAYFNGTTFLDYPAGSNAATTCAAPGATPNTANFDFAVGNVTDVGAYTGSASPYGTFDQGGNVHEWNEQIVSNSFRGVRGGSWIVDAGFLAASNPNNTNPTNENDNIGFRVASPRGAAHGGARSPTVRLSARETKWRRFRLAHGIRAPILRAPRWSCGRASECPDTRGRAGGRCRPVR